MIRMPPQRENTFAVPLPRPAQTVVVVDDDPGIVESLSSLLGEHGFAVEGFTDPATALDRLRRGPAPDLVLSDCLMPALTGAELMDALTAAGVDAPVVLMTALPDPGFCVDTAKVSVLNKPFQLEDLLAEIDAITRPMSGPRSARLRD
jgi:two-component system response regulator MprA